MLYNLISKIIVIHLLMVFVGILFYSLSIGLYHAKLGRTDFFYFLFFYFYDILILILVNYWSQQ